MKRLLKNIVTLIIERGPVLPSLTLAVALTSMPALALGAAQACSPAVASQTEQLPPGCTEKSATVNGVRINYKIGGHGPAVVLLHGYAETSHMWLPLMPQLATSHTVIVPDLRGAGNSERPQSGYDKKTMAKDIHELVQQLGYKEVSIVGHDIGLMVAYAYGTVSFRGKQGCPDGRFPAGCRRLEKRLADARPLAFPLLRRNSPGAGQGPGTHLF